MTKEVLPDSRKKCYRDQCNLVKNYQERIGLACAIPHVLEAVVSILMHYVKTGERLYPETYTRCQEMAKMWDGKECHVTIGGFSLNGFGIFFGKDVTDAGGVANIREF